MTSVAVVLVGLLGPTVPAAAQGAQGAQERYLTVSYDAARPIRDVAAEYLDDPNLWPDILATTGVSAVSDLRPGDALRIPANAISLANYALNEALTTTQAANKAGAQIFAPAEIGAALEAYADALRHRTAKNWAITKTRADVSTTHALKAYEAAIHARDQAGEAVLSDRQGGVEGRKNDDYGWQNRALGDLLEQQERVRTLSASTAQITFRDASRLRLQPNSYAVIEHMRVDPLTRREQSKVSLVEGNFYALLAAESERREFEVDLPNVGTTIDSGSFWVSNEAEEAKFANYDAGELTLTTEGEIVTLGRNEGAVVRQHQEVGTLTVLGPPALHAPADEARLTTSPVDFTWTPPEGAGGSWIEIASDPAFQRMVESHFGLQDPAFQATSLTPGVYYWRAAVLDAFGIPGERSPTWRFELAGDTAPPFLRIDRPEEEAIVREASVEVAGEVEPGAILTVGAASVLPQGNRFITRVPLADGPNAIEVAATDAAGNVTERVRRVTYQPDTRARVAFGDWIPRMRDGTLLTATSTLALGGRTVPGTRLEVRDRLGAVRAATRSEADGSFTVSVPLKGPAEVLVCVVIAASGFETGTTFRAATDRAAPALALGSPLPKLTSRSLLEIYGTTDADATVALNGEALRLDPGAGFSRVVSLSPGPNHFELTATDAVGNVTVLNATVTHDRTPPKVADYSLSVVGDGHARRLVVEVMVDDESGVAAAARARVSVGAEEFEAFVRYNEASKRYQGVVALMNAPHGKPALIEVNIEDNAGNLIVFKPS
ncbi:FecR domain-containing protein [Acuticoccus kandeliae]|uniref:FecR domain-containing protein n=1 Tax=Acuticoccus kandeliae TaxID=2073160 RepID=UPI001300A174|nr:FecR domain-containing protein [Acuticoccus kandeliae]